ncbi:hypothetical protein M9Y10_043014 [Tritrichomonas musculus]|uniref:F5/8 type C domain-containing protein n=1 Tax=Tritrichomonas musculus TaxID=1915356 RepID=A0ABR2JYH7_9EUKA
MSSTNRIQLDSSCIFGVPLQTYENEFTFLVNGEKFKTSRLISELLSPKICKIHSVDPTIDTFCINTSEHGHFSNILDLVKFNAKSIPTSEIPFIAEVVEQLGNETLRLTDDETPQELNLDTIIPKIMKHEKIRFYGKNFQEEIEFIASHFSEICDSRKEEMFQLQLSTLHLILSDPKLVLNDEDQLLNLVNELYREDDRFRSLYETVYFERVTSESISSFLDEFDMNDLTNATWQRLSNRLKQEIKLETNSSEDHSKARYKMKGTSLSFTTDNVFKGIVNHLRMKSNGNIDNEISFSYSSNNHENANNRYSDVRHISLFDDQSKSFLTKDIQGSWICLHFKNHRIIPSAYTIKTDSGSPYLRSWFIEASNDNSSWETIDEQRDCSYLKGSFRVHTFNIEKEKMKEIQYIRIRQIQTWDSYNFLRLNAFEVYGTLI